MFGNNMNYRKHWHFTKFFFFLAAASAFILMGGMVVKLLWNAILPDLLGVNSMSFLQAIGLLVLSRILFGRYGWSGARKRWSPKHRTHWREKWSTMTDEEKQAFKSKWQERCK